jgi:hypothetical protein
MFGEMVNPQAYYCAWGFFLAVFFWVRFWQKSKVRLQIKEQEGYFK